MVVGIIGIAATVLVNYRDNRQGYSTKLQACLQKRAQEKQALVEHRSNCDKARKTILDCLKKLEKDRFEWATEAMRSIQTTVSIKHS
jgi:hypothetical protein